MKKLSFLQAYEKHIDKVKKHGLTVTAVLAVGVLGSLGYQGYQDASYAKTIANKALLQDMGFVDTPIKVAPVKNIKDIITVNEPIDTLLTGTYTGGDITITKVEFTQKRTNNTPGPINTIINSKQKIAVNITFKNIGSTPIYMPILINGPKKIQGVAALCKASSKTSGGSRKDYLALPLTQGQYFLQNQEFKATLYMDPEDFGFAQTLEKESSNHTLTCRVESQQQSKSLNPDPNRLSWIFETNGDNNNLSIKYNIGINNPTPVNIEILDPIEIENTVGTKKGFDLAIKDITSIYNQQEDKIYYTMKIKNLGNADYDVGGLGIIPQAYIAYSNNTVSPTIGYLSVLGGLQDSQNIYMQSEVLGSISGPHTKCHTFKVGISYGLNGTALLPGDKNITNNTVEKCTIYNITNGTNPPTGSGNTYGYGYGYQPGYGYGYGYGYMTKYSNKSNFFYLTKPYIMISEKIYKVFKDQHKVMKKLTKGAVEKLFDRSTLRSMRVDIIRYLKKEINKAQNETRGMREKIAEIQKISKLYTQFTKDYSKRISAKESTKIYIKPTDTKKESTKTYIKPTDTKKESTKTYTKPTDTKKESTKTYIKPTDTKKEDTKTYDNVYGYKKTTK